MSWNIKDEWVGCNSEEHVTMSRETWVVCLRIKEKQACLESGCIINEQWESLPANGEVGWGQTPGTLKAERVVSNIICWLKIQQYF